MTTTENKSPIVAIITRTKNRPVFLERAMRCVEAQTYKDYIHVILNDGGDKKVISELVNKYDNKNRIVIHNDKSIGLVPALNQAIRSVDSEYITILDDDDTWSADRLKLSIEEFDRTGHRANAVKMGLIVEAVDGSRIRQVSSSLHPESGDGEISLYKQCYQNYLSNGLIMYERELFEEIGGYDESLETAEDWDFGIKLLSKYDVSLVVSKEPLSFYHQRPDQKGELGNSVHDGVSVQEKTINTIRNKYLREDIQKGRFGIGYIMNSTPNQLSLITRVEGHINFTANEMIKKIQSINDRTMTKRLFNKARSITDRKNR